MNNLRLSTLYKAPEDYKPPEEKTGLISNTDYPNLNSSDYAKRALNHVPRMFSAWESITLNEDDHLIIATNKLSGRSWCSALFGFKRPDGPLTLDTANFKLQINAIAARIKYVSKNIFILALRSGKVQLWSSYSKVQHDAESPICPSLIGEKTEHEKPIICLDVMKANTKKAVSGSKDGMLKLWDLEQTDLISTNTYRYAHCNSITGVDSSHDDDHIFATTSLDKSALLWDVRLTRPASGLYTDHAVRFQDIAWATPTTSAKKNLLYIGDESGFVHTVDKRLPKKFLDSFKHFDRPLRKILPNGTRLALIGDTNCVKIVDTMSDQKVIYENSEAQNFIRDCIWRTRDELLTVGFDAKLQIHKLSA